jgi:hypothetical protein
MILFYQEISRYIKKSNEVEIMASERVKYSSQLDPKLLKQARGVAKTQGRQFQSIIEEALTDYLEKLENAQTNPQVLNAFRKSLKEYEKLYSKLAK